MGEVMGSEMPENASEAITGIEALEKDLGFRIPDSVHESQDMAVLAQFLQDKMNADESEDVRDILQNADLPDGVEALLNWGGPALLQIEGVPPVEEASIGSIEADASKEETLITMEHITELREWSGDKNIETIEDAKNYFLTAGLNEEMLGDAPVIHDLLVAKGLLEA